MKCKGGNITVARLCHSAQTLGDPGVRVFIYLLWCLILSRLGCIGISVVCREHRVARTRSLPRGLLLTEASDCPRNKSLPVVYRENSHLYNERREFKDNQDVYFKDKKLNHLL